MLDDDGMLLTDCQQMIHSDAAGMDDDAELLRMTKNKKLPLNYCNCACN